MRGACSSAYTLTVNPAGVVGNTVSGFGTMNAPPRVGTPTGASFSARGWGCVGLICAPAIVPSAPAATATNATRGTSRDEMNA